MNIRMNYYQGHINEGHRGHPPTTSTFMFKKPDVQLFGAIMGTPPPPEILAKRMIM